MVKLHVKKGDEDLFLFETSTSVKVGQLSKELSRIHNGRLKIARMSAEMEELADHGTALPPNMVGLTDDQISELHLTDPALFSHVPSGGAEYHKDDLGRRNGQAPNAKMAEMLKKTIQEAKAAVQKQLVKEGKNLTYDDVVNQVMRLKGAIMIVYPMGLPLHDPLHLEMTAMQAENLDCANGGYRDVFDTDQTAIWWAGREMKPDQLLRDYIGSNEKTKVVVKLTAMGSGMPGREPVFSEEQKKAMMMHAFHRQQELEKLEEDDDDSYLNSQWADNRALKRSFQGIKEIKFAPS